MKKKLIRITTVPISLDKLLEGQLAYMNKHYDVTAISSDIEYLEKVGKKEEVNIFYLDLTRKITPLKDLLALLKLYRFLKKEKPLIVHTHTPKAGIIGMLASFFARVPYRLHTVAGLPLIEIKGVKRKILNFVEKTTYRFSTKIYPNSNGLLEIIKSNEFANYSKLKVINNGSTNGIDTNYFSKSHFNDIEIAKKRKELGISYDDFVFIFVGRIVKDKGINELINAFDQLYKINNNVSLLLVGPFEDDLDPISRVSKNLILQNNKIFTTGYKNDVRIYFALSDVLVFPSYREGFPNVVMQAGAMELTSIVSDINGCNEIIENKRNGWIIPVKDIDSLFTAMKYSLENKSVLLNMASDCRQMICSCFEQQLVWDAILKEYKNLEKSYYK